LLVRCPNCKTVIRLRGVEGQSSVFSYLCSSCQDIVRIDVARDQIKSSSTPDFPGKIKDEK
jgi:DNA-directed RNA polymerase subunit RPC12/RpoP